jgi:electron transport complex protein RnfB
MAGSDGQRTPARRAFFRRAGRLLAGAALGGGFLALWHRSRRPGRTWQIDPAKCIQCGLCRDNCVRNVSAAKAVHTFSICGYCDLCTAYFLPEPLELDTGAENLNCPTGALERRFVEDPFFEYTVKRDLCNGCGRCVKGCRDFGNGSLYLQIDQDWCLHCNQCAIARGCPAAAVVLVPTRKPYFENDRKWG